jgi:hypothetical protein
MNQSNLESLKEVDKHDQINEHYKNNCPYKNENEDPIDARNSIMGYLKNHLIVIAVGSAITGIILYKIQKEQRGLSQSFLSSTW